MACAEVYFRKLSDKKAHTNVMRIVKSHEATRRSAHAAASARKAAAPKSTLTSLAQQKAHAAEKLKDKALDKVLGSPPPHLHGDWAHPLPQLLRDRARPCHGRSCDGALAVLLPNLSWGERARTVLPRTGTVRESLAAQEAEKFYKDYTAQKTQLALAKEQAWHRQPRRP